MFQQLGSLFISPVYSIVKLPGSDAAGGRPHSKKLHQPKIRFALARAAAIHTARSEMYLGVLIALKDESGLMRKTAGLLVTSIIQKVGF